MRQSRQELRRRAGSRRQPGSGPGPRRHADRARWVAGDATRCIDQLRGQRGAEILVGRARRRAARERKDRPDAQRNRSRCCTLPRRPQRAPRGSEHRSARRGRDGSSGAPRHRPILARDARLQRLARLGAWGRPAVPPPRCPSPARRVRRSTDRADEEPDRQIREIGQGDCRPHGAERDEHGQAHGGERLGVNDRAAAAGLMSRLKISRAPTTGTAMVVVSATTTRNATPSVRCGCRGLRRRRASPRRTSAAGRGARIAATHTTPDGGDRGRARCC